MFSGRVMQPDGVTPRQGVVVGRVNDGWSLAVALLGHERTALGGGQTSTRGSKAGRNPLPVDGLVD